MWWECAKTYYFKYFNIFSLSLMVFLLRNAVSLRLESVFVGKWLKVGVDRHIYGSHTKAVLFLLNFTGIPIPQPPPAPAPSRRYLPNG